MHLRASSAPQCVWRKALRLVHIGASGAYKHNTWQCATHRAVRLGHCSAWSAIFFSFFKACATWALIIVHAASCTPMHLTRVFARHTWSRTWRRWCVKRTFLFSINTSWFPYGFQTLFPLKHFDLYDFTLKNPLYTNTYFHTYIHIFSFGLHDCSPRRIFNLAHPSHDIIMRVFE